MQSAGHRIIESVKQAIAGDFAVVTVDGQTWVRRDGLSLAVEALKECEVAYNNVFAEMQKNFPRITSIGEFDYLKRAADRARSAYESLTRKG